jgi:hypothetical protein
MASTQQENLGPENAEVAQTTLDEDLKRIREGKYDFKLEADVCNWIGQIIGRFKSSNETAAAWMKSGDVVCELMNCIRPGTIKKYNVNTASKFKQMENITLFLRACREVGMLEKDLFSTVDLYEAKDMNSVILSLFNLGGTIQSTIPYFKGPKLGIKQSTKFQVVPPLVQPVPSPPRAPAVPPVADAPPVSFATQAVTPIPEPVQLPPPPIVMAPVVQEPEIKQVAPTVAPISISSLIKTTPAPQEIQTKEPESPTPDQRTKPLSPGATSYNRETIVSRPSAQEPVAVPVVEQPSTPVNPTNPSPSISSDVPDIMPRKRTPLIAPSRQAIQAAASAAATAAAAAAVAAQVQQPPQSQFVMVPPHMMFPTYMPMHPAAMGSYQSYGSNLLRQVASAAPTYPTQPQVVGTNNMMSRRYISPSDNSDLSLERCVVEWIETIAGEVKPGQVSLHQWLRTGETLCRLANIILNASPNPNIRITTIAKSSDTVIQQRENGRRFVDICKALGVSEQDTFTPGDLYDGMNMRAVLNCILCLGGILQNYEWWVNSTYPQLGRRIKIKSGSR